MSAALAFFALVIEHIVGYPDWLLRAIGHPVIWMGKLIALLDRRLNRKTRRVAHSAALDEPPPQPSPACGGASRAQRRGRGLEACRVKPGHDEEIGTSLLIQGVFALLILLAVVAVVAFAIERALLLLPFGFIAVALAASSLIAQRSLYDHVARVATALESDGLAAGRDAVLHIVGRDVATLDQAGVARAAIESLAENFSDGVVAPALWLALGGLPGAALYKAVNTADSMIGHRTPRHQQFGWAAARLDDLVNLPASRLSALLLISAAAMSSRAAATNAWRTVRREAPRHRSPNAGYPEAAMAGALGISLAGPRLYAGVSVEDAFIGEGRREANAADIRAALALYQRADALLIAVIGALAAIIALA